MKLISVKKRIFSIILVALNIIPFSTANALAQQYTTKRLGGSTRFETAIEISKEFVAKSKKTVDSVILCTAYGYADSISVTPFAVYVNAPILITDKDTLTPATQVRISEMNVKKIYVIGGTGVISDNVMSQLTSIGLSVERIGGSNRFETNRLLLAKIPQDILSNKPKFVDAYDIYTGLAVTVDTVDKDDTNKINPIILVDKTVDTYTIKSKYIENIVTSLNNTYGLKLAPFVSMSEAPPWTGFPGKGMYGNDDNQINLNNSNYVFGLVGCTTSDLKIVNDYNYNLNGVNHCFADEFGIHPYTTNSALITTANNYVDALCVGPLAAITYSPIVFRNPINNYYKTGDYANIENIYYIGGSDVVPNGSESIIK